MFTFNNFLYINYLDLIIFIFFNVIVWVLCTTHAFRKKFVMFLLLLLLLSVWGFFKSFDGIIIMFLLTEFLVILLFLVINLTFSFYSKQKLVGRVYFFVYFLSASFIYLVFLPQNFSIFKFCYLYAYACIQDVISNDLFLFFQYFFVDFHLGIYYVALILTLFSIFFICFYFLLKTKQQHKKNNYLTFQILRKQNMIKQSLFKTQLRFFQK